MNHPKLSKQFIEHNYHIISNFHLSRGITSIFQKVHGKNSKLKNSVKANKYLNLIFQKIYGKVFILEIYGNIFKDYNN